MTAPTSGYGGIFWALPNQTWPEFNNKKYLPLLTIRTDELPRPHPLLEDVSLLNVFIHEDLDPMTDDRAVIIQHYDSFDELRPLIKPSLLNRLLRTSTRMNHTFHKISWSLKTDFPDVTTLEYLLGEDNNKQFWKTLEDAYNLDEIDNFFEQYACLDGMKIGGWPRMIQMSGIPFIMDGTPDYILQINNTEVYSYHDSGIGYLLRSQDGFYTIGWTTL